MPAEEVHVVRDVEVALVVGQHQVRLGDDPDEAAVGVHHRHARQLVLAAARATTSSTLASAVTDAGVLSMMSLTCSATGATLADPRRVRLSGASIPPAARRSRRRPSRGRRRAARRPRDPARPCASAPSAAASNGPSPLARRAPIRPESTSPVPAVASAGLPPGLTATGPAGLRHDRVVALQQHHGAAPLGGAPGAVEPLPLHVLGLELEQPAELGGVRGEHRGAGPVAEQLEARRRARSGRRRPPAAAPRPRARPARANSTAPSVRPSPGPSTTAPARSAISAQLAPPRRGCGRRPRRAGLSSSARAGAARPPAAPPRAPPPARTRRRRAGPSERPSSARR